MTQIELEPYVFWPFLAIGGFAFVLLPVLLTADKTQEFTFGLREKLGLSNLWQPIFMLAALLWLMIFVALVFGLLLQLLELIRFLAPESTIKQTEARFALVRLTAMTATLGAVVALPFTLMKVNLTREANETATEALFNDKLNAATEDLHAMRQRWDGEQNIWEDDITRRNAAIDRLEGLANERPDIAPRISRQLSVYVRELSHDVPAEYAPDEATPDELNMWTFQLEVQRSDMESAVQVLGRLKKISDVNPKWITIDLRKSNLQGFDLQNLKLDAANFSGAMLQGARLNNTDMKDSDLSWAGMQGTFLHRAVLQRADLKWSKFQGAILAGTSFSKSTKLDTTDFSGSLFVNVDFTSTDISHLQISSGFGDASVRLPNDCTPDSDNWPEHWPKEEIDGTIIIGKWRNWHLEHQGY